MLRSDEDWFWEEQEIIWFAITYNSQNFHSKANVEIFSSKGDLSDKCIGAGMVLNRDEQNKFDICG